MLQKVRGQDPIERRISKIKIAVYIFLLLLLLGGCTMKKKEEIAPCSRVQNYIVISEHYECYEYVKEDGARGVGPDTSAIVFQIRGVKIETIYPGVKISGEQQLFNFSLLEPFGISVDEHSTYREKFFMTEKVYGVRLVQIEDDVYGVIQKQS